MTVHRAEPDEDQGLRAAIRRGGERRFLMRSEAGAPADTPPPPVFQPPPVGTPTTASTPAPTPAPGPGPGGQIDLLELLGGLLSNPAVAQVLGALVGTCQRVLTGGAASAYDATLAEPGQTTPEIGTNELRRIVAERSAHVFDTRTPFEYSLGHVPGAVNAAPKPGVAMSQYVSDAAEIARIVGNKAAPVVLYCNGPFCGKSRRLGAELVEAGFTNVSRYQLGTPVWRALVGTMAIEPSGVRYVLENDPTATIIDARSADEVAGGALTRARNVPVADVIKAKDDGRLPMDDFNTRVVVYARDGEQAATMAEALVGQGFNNVKFFDGAFSDLLRQLM